MSFLDTFPQIAFLQNYSRRKNIGVYIVGGFLRDQLLNVPNQDLDFAVEKNALDLAKVFADTIGGAYVLLDEEHGCARVVHRIGPRTYTFDFADFRAETLEEDMRLRDFTINAFFIDVCQIGGSMMMRDLIQNLSTGFEDIETGLIRQTSDGVLLKDPLRMMRAFSLRAKFGFQIEEQTYEVISKNVFKILDVSFERIRDEFFKVLESPRTAETLAEMKEIGLLQKIMPQLVAMFDCDQGGYHHLNVWDHSIEAIHQFEILAEDFLKNSELKDYFYEKFSGTRSRFALTKLGLLLHDVGKPDTKKVEDERMSFHAHEHVGQKITYHIAKKFKLSNEERHALEDMVRFHLRPGYLSNEEKPSEKSIYRYFRDTKTEGASIALLSLADQRATRGELTSEKDQKHHEKICRQLVTLFLEKQKEEPFIPLVNGHDVMKYCDIQPSEVLGKILDAIYEKQALEEIMTREEALQYAFEYLDFLKSVEQETE